MSLAPIRSFYNRRRPILHTIILATACFAVYANGYEHAYNLDSGHGLTQNSNVRSLANIPSYFQDPLTLTSNRANNDYRPVLQTTFALNYAISGYDMWSWHLVQILLHVICVLGLYALCRRILVEFHSTLSPNPSPASGRGGSDRRRDWLQGHVPFLAALFFAVHPVNSGVVNYLWARSSLLVAAFLLPAIVLYLNRALSDSKGGTPWGAWLLFTLALFTKIEAISALGVFFMVEVLAIAKGRRPCSDGGGDNGPGSGGLLSDILRAINLRALRRLVPFLAVTLFYAVLRHQLVPDFHADARHAEDVTHLVYLATQVTAWWHYILAWFAPVELIADDLSYPIFRSFLEPAVILALAGWLLAAIICKVSYRGHPQFTFLVVTALAIISPTSSVMPLAEMVNEHRPYLPMAVLSLVWFVGLSVWFGRARRVWVANGLVAKVMMVLCLMAWLGSLSAMTWERNSVFQTEESYWADIQQKAPSSRSQLNYGIRMMEQGRYDEALGCFRASIEISPYWHITHINMGIILDALDRPEEAIRHYDQAVLYDHFTSLALEYRAHFHLSQAHYETALQDYEQSLERALERFDIAIGMATAYAGLGDAARAHELTVECLGLNPERTEYSIVAISTPFWESPDRYEAGIQYYRALDEEMPDRWWTYTNIGNLLNRLGRRQEAVEPLARGAELRRLRDQATVP